MIEFYQLGIGGRLALAVQPLQEMAGPFGEVDGARRVAMQAIATGAFAELQYIGLRKSGGALAA